MRTAQEITDSIAFTLFIDGPYKEDRSTGDERVNELLKEWKEEIIDRCIDVIALHCQDSTRKGMIASPGTMVLLLEDVKEE